MRTLALKEIIPYLKELVTLAFATRVKTPYEAANGVSKVGDDNKNRRINRNPWLTKPTRNPDRWILCISERNGVEFDARWHFNVTSFTFWKPEINN
jgi:hypothetical protein